MLLSIIIERDNRRDAAAHTSRLLLEISHRCALLADQVSPHPTDSVRKDCDLALAACRSINFATENAERHRGEYSFNDLVAADRLACMALGKKARAS